MPPSETGFLFESDMRERVLALLAFATLFLFVLSVGFAVYTIYLRVTNDRRAARWRRMEQAWEPPVLDILDGRATVADFLGRIPASEALHFVDYLLRIAVRIRGKERELLCDLARPYLQPLERRTREGDLTQRARAVRTLGVLGMADHAAVIVAALDDPTPLVSMVAARALARPEHPQYVIHVLDHLGRFEQWSRSFLCAMLVNVGPAAAEAIRNTLGDAARSARIRAIAADALRELKDLSAAGTAAAVLSEETDRNLLAACLRLIASVGSPACRPAVVGHCGSPDDVVRGAALSALARVGGAPDLELLRRGIEDLSPWVAIQAARGLRDGGGRSLLQEFAAGKHPRAALALQVLAEGR